VSAVAGRKGKDRGASAATPALNVLNSAGVGYHLHTYEHDTSVDAYGEEAARALGVDPARLFKTLIATTDDGRLVVGVVPVSGRLDLKALAGAVGAKRTDLAAPAAAQRATGYVVGGISPFGQRQALPCVVDGSALEHSTVYVCGGRRGLQVELAPADLVTLTAATTAAISRR
jgi:Cys-tRNA(Pro)/Cys-tRNA(Cys) deacylase